MVGAPSIKNHADGWTFDGLTFAGTEFDEIGNGELLRKESEEWRGGTSFAGDDVQGTCQFLLHLFAPEFQIKKRKSPERERFSFFNCQLSIINSQLSILNYPS